MVYSPSQEDSSRKLATLRLSLLFRDCKELSTAPAIYFDLQALDFGQLVGFSDLYFPLGCMILTEVPGKNSGTHRIFAFSRRSES